MQQTNGRIESMLFNYETTNKTDYHSYKTCNHPKTNYRKPPGQKVKIHSLKNVHTMAEWRGDIPRSDLFYKPKDILRTHPQAIQQFYEKPKDPEREDVQKTRPRLVMTPAVSMDDIEDPRLRNILCTDMYTSEISRGTREAVSAYSNITAPFPKHPAPSNPIFLQKLQPPIVPPEWRMESASWEGNQLRAHCDYTRQFWLQRDQPKCPKCDESAVVKARAERRKRK